MNQSIAATLASLDEQVVAKTLGFEFTRAELAAAFALVENPENWKFPIDAVVAIAGPREIIAVVEAVKFFAGCVASFEWMPAVNGQAFARVKAAGYYAAIGA